MKKNGYLVVAVIAQMFVLVAAFWVYSGSFHFPLQFDDGPNLQGLAQVHDEDSAFQFVAKGESGPLGRPIAYASFLINGMGWPDSVPEMRRVNVMIHIINGLLVFYLAYLLGRYVLDRDERAAVWAAVFVSAAWTLDPLLVSTSMMLVQRMTSLAALFLLASLVVYVRARIALPFRPRRSLVIMSLAVVVGGTLATLTKENGALLPIYLLAIEFLFSAKNQDLRSRGTGLFVWKSFFIYAPAIIIFAYVFVWTAFFNGSYATRGFTLEERLLTESRILWKYLGLALLPRGMELGPFHDDIQVSYGVLEPVSTLISIVAWFLVAAASWYFRKTFPLGAFAFVWYVGGHLLESTAIPLELYFEHRNYMPIIGPLFLMSQLPFYVKEHRRIFAIGGVFLTILYGVISWQTVTLWGQPMLSAEIWYKSHPSSVRAVQYLAQRYLEKNWVEDAVKLMNDARKKDPESISLALQYFKLKCVVSTDVDELRRLFDETKRTLRIGRHEYVIVRSVEKLISMERGGECNGILDQDMILDAIDSLLENERVRGDGRTMSNLYGLKARIYIERKDLERTVDNLKASFAYHPSPETAVLTAAVLASAGLKDEAKKALKEAMVRAPENPIKRWRWERLLNEYENRL